MNDTSDAQQPNESGQSEQGYGDGYGLRLTFNSTTEMFSTYNLTVASSVEGQLPDLVAFVIVSHEDRSIAVSTPAGDRNLPTKGLASWHFDEKDGEPRKRILGRSVARYVLPRAGRLLALLYAVES